CCWRAPGPAPPQAALGGPGAGAQPRAQLFCAPPARPWEAPAREADSSISLVQAAGQPVTAAGVAAPVLAEPAPVLAEPAPAAAEPAPVAGEPADRGFEVDRGQRGRVRRGGILAEVGDPQVAGGAGALEQRAGEPAVAQFVDAPPVAGIP